MEITPDQVGITLQSQTGEAGAARAERAPAPAPAEPEGGPGEGGSVDKIRDIIFGVQMRDYDKRFTGLEERMSRELATLRDETSRRFDALQTFMRQELDALGQRLTHEQQVRTETTQALGNDLRQQLADQGQQLTGELTRRFSELTASLDHHASTLRHEKTDRATLAALLTEVAQKLANHADPGGER